MLLRGVPICHDRCEPLAISGAYLDDDTCAHALDSHPRTASGHPNSDSSVGFYPLADGFWTSQTVQSNKVVAEMAGSYEQKKASATTGTLVFTPVKSKTTAEHRTAQIEEDKYTLEQGGKVLRLVSSINDVMVFHERAYAK
jgi:hypothetical protein